MDSHDPDRDEAYRVATAYLVETQAEIQRLLSDGLQAAGDQDLFEIGYRVQLSADAINRLLRLRGYGPESRG
jgi:hypothetical protein